MRHSGWMTLLAAACLTACSSGDEPVKTEAPRLMTVEVTERPMDDDGAAESATSRAAAVTTTASLSSFSMNYQSEKYIFTKGSTWNTPAWPGVGSDVKIDFYAYTHGTFNYNSGNPYVTFTVENEPSNQQDLLVAERKQISYNDESGKVSLTFDHACAAVLFKVQITNTLREQLGHDLTVNSIVLKNVNNAGDYYYGSKSWSDLSGDASYTLTNSEITVGTTEQGLSSKYLFMIPQTRTANGITGTYLEINYTNSESKQATIPLNIDWQSGKCYTTTIKLGTNLIK